MPGFNFLNPSQKSHYSASGSRAPGLPTPKSTAIGSSKKADTPPSLSVYTMLRTIPDSLFVAKLNMMNLEGKIGKAEEALVSERATPTLSPADLQKVFSKMIHAKTTLKSVKANYEANWNAYIELGNRNRWNVADFQAKFDTEFEGAYESLKESRLTPDQEAVNKRKQAALYSGTGMGVTGAGMVLLGVFGLPAAVGVGVAIAGGVTGISGLGVQLGSAIGERKAIRHADEGKAKAIFTSLRTDMKAIEREILALDGKSLVTAEASPIGLSYEPQAAQADSERSGLAQLPSRPESISSLWENTPIQAWDPISSTPVKTAFAQVEMEQVHARLPSLFSPDALQRSTMAVPSPQPSPRTAQGAHSPLPESGIARPQPALVATPRVQASSSRAATALMGRTGRTRESPLDEMRGLAVPKGEPRAEEDRIALLAE